MESGIFFGLIFIFAGVIGLFFQKWATIPLFIIGVLLLFFSKRENIIEERKDLINKKT